MLYLNEIFSFNEMTSTSEQRDSTAKNSYCKPKITNVCGTAKISCRLRLNMIYNCKKDLNFINKRYNKKVFRSLICKVKSTGVTILLFKNGSITLVGGKSIDNLSETMVDVVKELARVWDYTPILCDFNITNICASMKTGYRVDLFKMVEANKTCCSLEPELFPGAKFKINKLIITIHHTGACFGTGFKNIEQIKETFNILQKLLLLYKI